MLSLKNKKKDRYLKVLKLYHNGVIKLIKKKKSKNIKWNRS